MKFLLAAVLAFGVLYIMNKRAEKYNPYDPVYDIRQPYERMTPRKPKKPVKGKKKALLKAVKKVNCPMNTGISAQLLPKPRADDGFGQFAPNPEALIGKNFVDASRWVSLGAMTSRRNINRDLRSEPTIPKSNAISPWNQSSIEQQMVRNALDCP